MRNLSATVNNYSCCESSVDSKWSKILVDYINLVSNSIAEVDISSEFINWAQKLDNDSTYNWSALLDRTFPGIDWSKIKFDEETSTPINWSEVL